MFTKSMDFNHERKIEKRIKTEVDETVEKLQSSGCFVLLEDDEIRDDDECQN